MQTSVTQLRTTGVDLGGLMTVLGRHLYSTPIVALRELVQNAHDSIVRRRLEQPEWLAASSVDSAETGSVVSPAFGAAPTEDAEKNCAMAEAALFSSNRITVHCDSVKGIIRVVDTGAGLTEHEIHTYLATVGVGYTRTLREKDDTSGLIGMFGLGFLSAFVLAREVVVTTTSYQDPDVGLRYQSYDGQRYSVTHVAPRPVGTEVALFLRDDFTVLAEEGVLRRELLRYCALLREPVYIGNDKEALNPHLPPWREEEGNTLEHPVRLRRKRMDFAQRFDTMFDPVCTLPVVPSVPLLAGESDAIGLLWVQSGGTYGTSDNRQLSVFCRGMLLDDDARDLLPPWAGFISGVIESDRLTPTASREALQRDNLYYATRQAISEALIVGLSKVAETQPEAWRRVLTRHNEALLGAALCDERLFSLLADAVRIPTSQGDVPARTLKTSKGSVNVMLGSQGGFEDMLFRVLRTPVARGERYAVVPFLRKWVQKYGGVLVELGTSQGNRRLFAEEKLPESEIAFLRQSLAHEERCIPARFAPAELPFVVVPDREALLKRLLEEDDTDKRISTAALRLARNFTAAFDDSTVSNLYLNLDNIAVAALLDRHRQGLECAQMAGMLKSLKVIMAGNDESFDGQNLHESLGLMCSLVANYR